MNILKRPVPFLLWLACAICLVSFTYASCVSTKNTTTISGTKLVSSTSLSAGEGESEIRITWSGNADTNKTPYPLAVITDWYESDDAMKAGTGEKGRLAAQIDIGKSERIIVKNGVAVLHFSESMYDVRDNTWKAVEHTKENVSTTKLVPITLENNTITGTTVVTHPQDNMIFIEVIDAGMDWYPVNVRKDVISGRETASRSGAEPAQAAVEVSQVQQLQSGEQGEAASGVQQATPRYHVAIGDQPAGPFDMNELLHIVQTEQLSKQTLVWKEGMQQWEAAGNIQELASLFQTVSAPPNIAQTQPQYNVALNGISSGPYTLEELKPFIENGRLTKETLIWKEGAFQWVVASAVPEIAALIPQTAKAQEPAADSPADKFFIIVDGQPSGPLSIDNITQQIEKRQIIRSSLVWKEGMRQWAAAETIPELTGIFPVIPPPPPPQAAQSPKSYYIAVNGYPDGPFTTDEVRQKFQSGQINQSALVWKEDMPQWAPISTIPELSFLFTASAATPAAATSQTAQEAAPQPVTPDRYHIAVNGFSTGPFIIEELKQKVQSGQLTKNTLVWKSGMTQWAPAETFTELQSLFNEEKAK
ncbi:MAG: DUF4339 domain-containing protein [Treponema sp.]|jgi:hypothetical protein|nr:DUF4339 domain-containing protein [Treponema sp.]